MPILERQCTRPCAYMTVNFKCVFSLFETFYPRHVQRPITLAVYDIFAPLESLINCLSNDVINPIVLFFTYDSFRLNTSQIIYLLVLKINIFKPEFQ